MTDPWAYAMRLPSLAVHFNLVACEQHRDTIQAIAREMARHALKQSEVITGAYCGLLGARDFAALASAELMAIEKSWECALKSTHRIMTLGMVPGDERLNALPIE